MIVLTRCFPTPLQQLFFAVKNIEQFSLPVLEEKNTMASIRIDTGFEKVDTDYVPLDDINVLFNQEFCL